MRPSETKDAITVRLKGGLGNQMFQYAAGRALSLRHNVPLMLDLSAFGSDPKRSYALQPFAIEAGLVSLSLWLRLWRKVTGRYYREQSFAHDPKVSELSPGMLLNGFFQSEKYFLDHADKIRHEFSLKEPLSQKAHDYLREMERTPNSVAVHVRRGDYVSDAKTAAFHGNCSWEYYEKAMRLMRARLGDVLFFFFSDEPEWLAAQQVRGTIVSGLSPHEDMHLMSCCRHQIIANSSFSWWGAWLNQSPDKIVVAPRRWFADEKMERQTGDLIPNGWVRV